MAIETLLAETTIQGCVRKESAWNLVCDFAAYPSIMEHVDKVEVLERNDDQGLSRWYVSVDGAPLSWLEKDLFNHSCYEVRFSSIEGDFDSIAGRWRIADTENSGITISLAIEYDLGIPALETVLGPVLRKKMNNAIEAMVRAVQKTLSAHAIDERRSERRAINRRHCARYGGTEHELFIVNLSAGGMLIRGASAPVSPGMLQLSIAMLDIATVTRDEQADCCRIHFSRPLDEEVFTSLADHLMLSGKTAVVTPASCAMAQDAVICTTEQELPLQLLELTAEGMSLSVRGTIPMPLESFSIGSTTLPLKRVVHDGQRNMVNVYFKHPLSSQQLQLVRNYFKTA